MTVGGASAMEKVLRAKGRNTTSVEAGTLPIAYGVCVNDTG